MRWTLIGLAIGGWYWLVIGLACLPKVDAWSVDTTPRFIFAISAHVFAAALFVSRVLLKRLTS